MAALRRADHAMFKEEAFAFDQHAFLNQGINACRVPLAAPATCVMIRFDGTPRNQTRIVSSREETLILAVPEGFKEQNGDGERGPLPPPNLHRLSSSVLLRCSAVNSASHRPAAKRFTKVNCTRAGRV